MGFLSWCCDPYSVLGAIGITLGLYYLIRIFFVNGRKCPSKARIDGKTVIITGGNTGIGKATAILLAERGGRIILACRNVQKGNSAVQEIKGKTGNESVFCKSLDLASMASIRKFSEDILETEDKIDMLLLNAGVMIPPYQLTEDGFELQFGVNHLGHFLLTHLLLNRLKTSAPSRVVVVSSLAHMIGTIDYDDMMWEKSYNRFVAYGRSKLANVMFARELGKHLSGTGVTTCSLHPGSIDTELTRYIFQGWLAFMEPLGSVFKYLLTKTREQGSQTSLYCAVAKEVEGQSGAYYDNCRMVKPKKIALDDEECRKLWDYSLKTLKLH